MKDSIIVRGDKITGDFALQVIDVATGEVKEYYEDKNLVVTLGRQNIAKLLGGDAAGKPISLLGVGSNGTAPVLTDTALTDAFTKSISGVAYPAVNSVRYSWSLEAGDANGITIREFALLNADNVLIARKVRAEIVKSSAVRLVGAWTISIN